jgi:signal transduction histidine kinase
MVAHVARENLTGHQRASSKLVDHKEQLLKLSAELLHIEERVERRIARVLHDELGQTLAAARMAICKLRDSEGCAIRVGRLEELQAHLDRAIEVTRSFTYQLSPPILHDLGLAAALQALGEQTEKEHGLCFVFALVEGWSPPAEDVGVVLYRVLRELLHNVTKHARARRVRLELTGTCERIRIVLEDDGVGFNVAGSGRAGSSLGLFQARERLARLGGILEIDSTPGRGTRVVLSLGRTEPAAPERGDCLEPTHPDR